MEGERGVRTHSGTARRSFNVALGLAQAGLVTDVVGECLRGGSSGRRSSWMLWRKNSHSAPWVEFDRRHGARADPKVSTNPIVQSTRLRASIAVVTLRRNRWLSNRQRACGASRKTRGGGTYLLVARGAAIGSLIRSVSYLSVRTS